MAVTRNFDVAKANVLGFGKQQWARAIAETEAGAACHPHGSRRAVARASTTQAPVRIDLAEPRQDHRVLKLSCRRIAGARERQSARVFERERASPAFGHDWTHDLLSFARL